MKKAQRAMIMPMLLPSTSLAIINTKRFKILSCAPKKNSNLLDILIVCDFHTGEFPHRKVFTVLEFLHKWQQCQLKVVRKRMLLTLSLALCKNYINAKFMKIILLINVKLSLLKAECNYLIVNEQMHQVNLIIQFEDL